MPGGRGARIRGLQTHRQNEDRACPVSRVAANLGGIEREDLARGDVVAAPGAGRPTSVFDASIEPVRDLDRIPTRGAFKIYVGAAEIDATIRAFEGGFARIR